MKRWIAVILLAVLLCGCGNTSASTEPTDTPIEELWVIVDIPVSNIRKSISTIEELAEGFEDSHEDVQIRLDMLPSNVEERDARLEQLRAEIMAGKGPDVYIIATDNLRADNGQFVRPASLFTDVTQSMYNGAFTDIRKYYDSDEELDKESLETTVMNAGMVGDAQYVLPLYFDYPIIVTTEEKLAQSGISLEILESGMGTIMDALLVQENVYLFSAANVSEEMFGFNMYSKLINYHSGDVLLTTEEVADYMRMYQAKREIVKDTYLGKMSFDEFVSTEQPFMITTLSDAKTYAQCKIIPMCGLDSKLVADVDYWGAVGSSCSDPALAYQFLRTFLLEDFQWSGAITDAWPVRTKGYTLELDAKIDIARFSITSLEREVYSKTLYRLNDSANGYVPRDVDINALAENLIQELEWHVAEG